MSEAANEDGWEDQSHPSLLRRDYENMVGGCRWSNIQANPYRLELKSQQENAPCLAVWLTLTHVRTVIWYNPSEFLVTNPYRILIHGKKLMMKMQKCRTGSDATIPFCMHNLQSKVLHGRQILYLLSLCLIIAHKWTQLIYIWVYLIFHSWSVKHCIIASLQQYNSVVSALHWTYE